MKKNNNSSGDSFYESVDDIYCYKGTNVLKNRLGIKDYDELEEAERRISMDQYFYLDTLGVTGDFSLKHLCSIHRELFGDIYDWAGQIRKVNISKGTFFCFYEYIESEYANLYLWLRRENYLADIDDQEILLDKLSYFLGELNMIHPFREGNGRTQRIFLKQLMKNNGRFRLDFEVVSPEEMRAASHDTTICQYTLMKELLKRCITRVKK